MTQHPLRETLLGRRRCWEGDVAGNGADYLLKPCSKERFDKAMQKLQQPHSHAVEAVVAAALQHQDVQNRIVVKDNGKIKIIPLNTVRYLEAAEDYVKICTND